MVALRHVVGYGSVRNDIRKQRYCRIEVAASQSPPPRPRACRSRYVGKRCFGAPQLLTQKAFERRHGSPIGVVCGAVTFESTKAKEAELQANYVEVVDFIETNLVRCPDAQGRELVSCAELKDILQREGTLLTDRELDRLLHKYEGSHPGYICRDDIKNIAVDFATQLLWISLALMQSKMEYFDKTFNFGDKDGSHIINSKELQSLLEVVGGSGTVLRKKEIDNAIRQYDEDRKGGINKREFMLMVRNRLIDISDVMKFVVPAAATVMEGALMGKVVELANRRQLQAILKEEEQRLVIVQAGFTWCRPCIGFKRKYEKMASMYKEARFLKLTANLDEHTEELYQYLSKQVGTMGTPTHIYFRGRNPVAVSTGSNPSKMKAILHQLLHPHEKPADFLINSI